MSSSLLNLRLHWEQIFAQDNALYFFPNPVTEYMEKAYSRPAIYRWCVSRGQMSDGDVQPIYIGTATQLCPERLSAYLNPFKSATNERLNKELSKRAKQGMSVILDTLRVLRANVNNYLIDESVAFSENILQNFKPLEEALRSGCHITLQLSDHCGTTLDCELS